jgi:RNA polymerase sigma factor FliA
MRRRIKKVQGDTTARDEALMRLYPAIGRFAKQAAAMYGLPPSVDADDLVTCGVIGVVDAWTRFDAERDVPFEAYAVRRVKGAVVDAIRAADWVPRKTRERARRTGEAVVALVSIDATAAASGARPFADVLPDSSCPNPDAHLLEVDTMDELRAALNRLPERERLIVTSHYFDRTLLGDIGIALGVSASRVSQLHNRALRSLRGDLDKIDAVAAA